MSLRAELVPRGGTGDYDLVIGNAGDGEVVDLEVSLDGQPITEHHDCMDQGVPSEIPSIPAGNSISYFISRTFDSPDLPLNLEITFRDETGEQRTFSHLLTT